MTMTWNKDQQIARDAIMQFVEARPNDSFVMAGLAGTGKTTLVCDILAELKDRGVRVAVIAPTGKAATVLNSKQNYFKASTIHRLLYKRPNDAMSDLIDAIEGVTAQIEFALGQGMDASGLQSTLSALRIKLEEQYRSQNKLSFFPRDPAEVAQMFDVVFVDEASMVSQELVADIGALGLPTVYLGDPNQLFPVGQEKFSVRLDRPNVKLEEIMRQGAGSPILSLSRAILKAKGMPSNKCGVRTTPSTNPLAMLRQMGEGTQFIAYRNETRRTINRHLRNELVGSKRDPKYPFLPVPGEQLMIDANEPDKGLMKGDLVTFEQLTDYKPDGKRGDFLFSGIITDRIGVKQAIRMHANDLMLSENHAMGISDNRGQRSDYENDHYRFCAGAYYDGCKVMFPYAITCHKAQGSEWDSVVLFNDPHPKSACQYLYTGVTRARENLMLAMTY